MSDFWDHEVVERQHVEWMASLPVRQYLNRLISETPFHGPIEWFHSWLQGRTFGRGLSIGCGAGALERDLIQRGLVKVIDAFDGSLTSLHIARAEAARTGMSGRIRYFAADFNRCALPRNAYDVVFFHQSAHHVARLESLFAQVLAALKPDGLVYLDEYIGPSRFDWSEELLAPQQAFYSSLPQAWRLSERLSPPIQADDPSEAVRSGEIERCLRIGFKLRARRPYGGTLLSVILPYVNLQFLSEEALGVFIAEEQALLAAGMPPFYAVIVAAPRRGGTRAVALGCYAALALTAGVRLKWAQFRAELRPKWARLRGRP